MESVESAKPITGRAACSTVESGATMMDIIIVEGDRVLEHMWAMMPHVEFVKRTVGELPDGAWVGTVSKIDGDHAVISSKTFYGTSCQRQSGSRRQ